MERSSLSNRLAAPARRSKWLTVASSIWRDWLAGLRRTHGDRSSRYDAQSAGQPVSEAVAYIDSAFNSLLRWAGLESVEGLRLLELGPGDNLGLALRFLAAGAASVVCLDRFEVQQDEGHQRAIYRALLETLTPVEQARIHDLVQNGEGERLRVIRGIGIEESDGHLGPESFDLIYSIAVMEHVYDSDDALAAMDRLLAPGGLLAHQIDLRDHGVFTQGGLHPLTFLTVPDWAYDRMERNRGGPNRRLVDYYRSRMRDLGYEYRLLIGRIVGADRDLQPYKERLEYGVDYDETALELVRRVRPKLIPRFRALSDEDLLAAGAFLTARKPAAARD
jgi:SAM-dependent methyltransferase